MLEVRPARTANGAARFEAAAQAYLRRGWSVIPIQPADKRPLIPWRAYQERHATVAEVAGWLRRWPRCNLAIVTGAISGLVVLDVDPRHGGEASLKALNASQGPLPDTLSAASGGGGRHLYFAHPGPRIANRAGLRPGLDLRADGGYIVAPPSLHASGQRYRWLGQIGQRAALALWPSALAPVQRFSTGRSRTQWRQFLHAGIDEGRRNSGLASLAGHLLWRQVDPGVILELLLSWNQARCRPPLPEAEVARILASVQRTRQRHAQVAVASAVDPGARKAASA
ncbi:MAG: bifunctional DNA primase/polymerase [Halochromatium sp.]